MDLNRAATFLRVVEAGGFTAAAHALRLPTSSVSRSVAKLEAELGITLLQRTTRSIALTDAGRAYFERARDALAGLDEATALALDAARAAHGPVCVAAPPDLAPALGGLIAPFLARYPRIRVEVVVSARPADAVRDRADLGLVLGRLPDSALTARRIGQSAHQLYAAPSYLAARGRPRALADLARHDALLLTGSPTTWHLDGPRGRDAVTVTGVVSGDHPGFLVEAAVAGLGVALLPPFPVMRHLAAGALEVVLPRHSVTEPLQLVSQATRHLAHRVILLRDHLVEAMAQSCTKHG